MAFSISIKAKSSPIEAILKHVSNFETVKAQMFDEIGAELVGSLQMRFVHGVDVDGNPWKVSWRARMQGGETLRDTGRLMNSYTYNVLGSGVEVGTDVMYAPYLHFGATIQPKNSQYITFSVGSQYRKVKQVINPPREQLGLSSEDEVMVLDIVGGFINDYILRST